MMKSTSCFHEIKFESCLFIKGIGETLNLSASYPENLKTELTPLHIPPSS